MSVMSWAWPSFALLAGGGGFRRDDVVVEVGNSLDRMLRHKLLSRVLESGPKHVHDRKGRSLERDLGHTQT